MTILQPITDFHDPTLDIYARTTENQLLRRDKPEEGVFIAESPKVVERALAAGCIPLSLLMEDKHVTGEGAPIIEKCAPYDIPVFTAPFDVLKELTGFALTRGLLCAMRRPRPVTVSDICKDARRIAILEDVVNPTNVGAIFRSAAALSIDGILLTPSCSDPLYRRSIRVSMGTVFQIPWTYLDASAWPIDSMEYLRSIGFQTAAMALTQHTIPISDARLAHIEKLAILLGNEGDGLSSDTISRCDYTVKIPMAPGIDSLNVAAASAVAFWELSKR